MKCEEITISRENIQEIFKKISQCLKANPDTHIFLSENIINVLKKEGKDYHIIHAQLHLQVFIKTFKYITFFTS